MDLDRLDRLMQQMEQLLQGQQEQFLEIETALSAQRYLLEVLYANAFIADPDGFEPLMQGLIAQTRGRATTAGPMEPDEKIERQARLATHLVRFGDAVQLRLSQGYQ